MYVCMYVSMYVSMYMNVYVCLGHLLSKRTKDWIKQKERENNQQKKNVMISASYSKAIHTRETSGDWNDHEKFKKWQQ